MKALIYFALIAIVTISSCKQNCSDRQFSFEEELSKINIQKNIFVLYNGRDTTCKEAEQTITLTKTQINELKCILFENSSNKTVKMEKCLEPDFSIYFQDKNQKVLSVIDFSSDKLFFKSTSDQFKLSSVDQLIELRIFFKKCGIGKYMWN